MSSSAASIKTGGATKQPVVHASVLGVLAALATWHERWRQRRQLEAMDDRAMQDLGLSRADIYREASKPFWTR